MADQDNPTECDHVHFADGVSDHRKGSQVRQKSLNRLGRTRYRQGHFRELLQKATRRFPPPWSVEDWTPALS
jgi:hypothetical protein